MSRLGKRKGERGEREVTEILRAAFPEVRRRVNGEERQDNIPGRDIQGTPGYCVQVNLSAEPRPMPKLKEAITAARAGEIPLAFTRKSSKIAQGEPWLVSMLATDFVKLLGTDFLNKPHP